MSTVQTTCENELYTMGRDPCRNPCSQKNLWKDVAHFDLEETHSCDISVQKGLQELQELEEFSTIFLEKKLSKTSLKRISLLP